MLQWGSGTQRQVGADRGRCPSVSMIAMSTGRPHLVHEADWQTTTGAWSGDKPSADAAASGGPGIAVSTAMQATRTSFTVLSALFTGLLCASGCADFDATSDRYAAFTPARGERTPDPVAGMALALDARQGAVIDLAPTVSRRAPGPASAAAAVSTVRARSPRCSTATRTTTAYTRTRTGRARSTARNDGHRSEFSANNPCSCRRPTRRCRRSRRR